MITFTYAIKIVMNDVKDVASDYRLKSKLRPPSINYYISELSNELRYIEYKIDNKNDDIPIRNLINMLSLILLIIMYKLEVIKCRKQSETT